MVKAERRWRNLMGYFLSYQMTSDSLINALHWRSRLVAIPDRGFSYKVPSGYFVELGPSLTYVGVPMMSSNGGELWSLFITEWAVSAARNLLWDTYDRFRLWSCPSDLIRAIRVLDCLVPLGGESNAHDFLGMLYVIERAT